MSDNNDVVMIQLDRPREIRFGHKAIKMLGAMTGEDVDAATVLADLDLDKLEKIYYCALLSDSIEHGETLKLEDMENIMDKARPFAELIVKMQEAFTMAFSGPKKANGEPQAGNVQLNLNRKQRRSASTKA